MLTFILSLSSTEIDSEVKLAHLAMGRLFKA